MIAISIIYVESYILSVMDCSTGEPDRPPSKVGVAVTDLMTGLYAHGAILASLRSVQHTGNGVWIDCNLFETQVR
jgi:succinate--hydroxymethylglutarate CoA-transferase